MSWRTGGALAGLSFHPLNVVAPFHRGLGGALKPTAGVIQQRITTSVILSLEPSYDVNS